MENKITMLNMDCMEYLSKCKDKEFDLAIVDPPYGIGNWVQVNGNVRRDGEAVEWNEPEHRPTKEFFAELQRVSEERIIWGANYYNCFDGEMGAIVWDKQNPNPKFSACEIASYSKHKRVAKVKIPYAGFVGEEKNFHPCAKPVALYRWLLKNYAKEGDRILDTHGGSFSSAIAVHQMNQQGMNLSFTGCEIDKDYFEAAKKRFDLVTSQTSLTFKE